MKTRNKKNKIVPLLADGYKAGHFAQMDSVSHMYETYISRKTNKLDGFGDKITWNIAVGMQMAIKKIVDDFDEYFFERDKNIVIAEFREYLADYLIIDESEVPTAHWEQLHDLGHLPIRIKAIPEGTVLPLGIPIMSFENTHPDFAWLPGWLETIITNKTWYSITCATVAMAYKRIAVKYANDTCDNLDHIPFQCHDFGFRGNAGEEAAVMSDLGHIVNFLGSDTMATIPEMKYYYNANKGISHSIYATEHSTMETFGDTIKALRYFMNNPYKEKNGKPISFSCVWDTWDYYGDLARLPEVKDEICARLGKVVIRPDSGDPVKIVCGDPEAEEGSIERIGTMQHLWNIFGGSTNSKGYKVLDPHIGLIYGDAITLERAEEILRKLKEAGFAASNIVFGIGAKAYVCNTRDTLSIATKANYCVQNGTGKAIFKQPKTDSTKKSLKGLSAVIVEDGKYVVKDQLSKDAYNSIKEQDQLKEVFVDGIFVKEYDLYEIRKTVEDGFKKYL